VYLISHNCLNVLDRKENMPNASIITYNSNFIDKRPQILSTFRKPFCSNKM